MPHLFKPKECEGCVLYNEDLEKRKIKDSSSYQRALAGRGFSQPDGKGNGGVVVFLESLGDNEVDDGLPVRPHAPAGSVFQRVINRSPGLARDDFTIYNTIQCQPPWNKLSGTSWETGAIGHCAAHRDALLTRLPLSGPRFKQRVILTLGAVPFKTFTGLEGEYLNLTDIRGYPIDTGNGLVVGSYHPSHIQQGSQKLMGVLMLDMRMAVHWAKNGFQRKKVNYNEYPSLDEAWSLYFKARDNRNLPIAFDIETPNVDELKKVDRIFSVQFSLEPQTGMFFPWGGEYIDISRKLLALENDKVGHNVWRFDTSVLRDIGGVQFGGNVHDTIWAFHHFQPDLTTEEKKEDDAAISSRMGLQYVASFFGMDFHWKHLKFDSTQQRRYGIADVDACQRIWSKLPGQMKAMGVWKGYEKLRFGLEPVLVNMSERGIPVDDVDRLKLREEILQDKVDNFNKMQELVPDEIKNFEPKKTGYKKGWKAIKAKEGRVRVPEDFEAQVIAGKVEGVEWFDEDSSSWFPVREISTPDGPRPARILPFKPSNDQVIRYAKFKGHQVSKKKVKDARGSVESADQKEVAKLAKRTKDQLYKTILEYRGCETALSRYVDKWQPGLDDKVHSQFLYVPATGQLNSVDPNAQNFIKHGNKDGVDRKYAQRLRGMIKAPAGYKLLEFDYSAFHALTTGFEARDSDYMRLARLDMHSFVTAHFLNIQKVIPTSDLPNLKWSDADLLKYLAEIKKKYKDIRDTKAKPAGLGYGFGMGPNKLHQQNEETMTLKDARALMKLLDDLFPVAKKWRSDIKVQADRQGFLISRYGFIRWFWDVFSRKKVGSEWVVHNGSDAEDAIAFLPANSAHCHMQENMIALEYGGFLTKFEQQVAGATDRNYNKKFGLINMIHDALLYMCPDKLVDECVATVKSQMEKPSSTLVDSKVAPGGLKVGVDVQIGQSWDLMQKFV